MSDTTYDAIVIGAGFGGLYALHHLRDRMGLRVHGFDGASDVGGTWWYNRYPGARVDAPSSPFYAYTFSQDIVDEWVWPETQSTQADVLRYVEFVADRLDLRKDITFDTFVSDARYDDATQHWTIETDQGEEATARFLICAVGALSAPNKPDIPGIDEFGGKKIHTARWDHDYQLEGKKVAVIGTGASAVQVVPSIAEKVGKLEFQVLLGDAFTGIGERDFYAIVGHPGTHFQNLFAEPDFDIAGVIVA